jgi:hypothetical protein
MPQEYERSSIGATSGSQPIPGPKPQVYQGLPYTAVLEQKNQELTQRVQEASNHIGYLIRRVDYSEDIIRVLLESCQKQIDQEGYNAKDILDRYMEHTKLWYKIQKEQQEINEKNRNRFK